MVKKKKVFFVLSSFRAGGAERVFWLLSQYFNKSLFDVSVVLLTGKNSFYSTDLEAVNLVDLKTVKASRSFFKLYRLIKKENPDVVFSTGGQVNLLLALLSLVIKPVLIARPTNQDNSKYVTLGAKVQSFFTKGLFKRFTMFICQSEEIRKFVSEKYNLRDDRLIMIPNPITSNNIVRKSLSNNEDVKKLIVVARLTPQKGIERLIEIIRQLPSSYHLTIVGDGVLREKIEDSISLFDLKNRVQLMGLVTNVLDIISSHDVFVLPSFIEGFPNVVLESLSVGTPVVSFQVGGISEIIRDGFNGFIIEQDNLSEFKEKIIESCHFDWRPESIRTDIQQRFGIEKVTKKYEKLVLEKS